MGYHGDFVGVNGIHQPCAEGTNRQGESAVVNEWWNPGIAGTGECGTSAALAHDWPKPDMTASSEKETRECSC